MSSDKTSRLWPGVPLAIASAVLFGAAAPLSKAMLGTVDPQLLAGLLYLGQASGWPSCYGARAVFGIPAAEAPLRLADAPRLAIIIFFGGIVGPVLLMLGLSRTDAASGSLLLNLEGLATMVIAWVVFRENVDRRLVLGAIAIILGAVVLSWNGTGISADAGALLICGACMAWAIDNNLTRKLSAADPVVIAMAKGLVAGMVNIGIALARGAQLPDAAYFGAAMLLGFLAVGASLVLFILALRHLGTARTGAYFSLAPFVGAVIAIAFLGEPLVLQLGIAASSMGFGLWMHLTERHAHSHDHEFLEHEHSHVHDDHHLHRHDGAAAEPHSHRHSHPPMRHRHAHFPDLHHRHGHSN